MTTIWRTEDPARIGNHTTRTVGKPAVEDGPSGRAIVFDGRGDGIFVPTNPIAGWPKFTIEALFRPDAPGEFEQRFLHVGEPDGARALLELRLTPEHTWYLDTFLESGGAKQALIDPAKQHAAGRWYWAALTYDGARMAHFVNGVPEKSAALAIPPLPEGAASLGVRQTLISWFHGAIREVRFHDQALPADALQRI